jgi:hypothetical protein
MDAVPAKGRRDKHPFTTEEDARLADLVAQHGENAWHEIERVLPGRTSRQCRERWNLYLSPNVSNEPWSAEEDALLMRLYSVIGPKWTLIGKSFPKRTANNIKNRQKQILRRAQRVTRIAPTGQLGAGIQPQPGLDPSGADAHPLAKDFP